MMYSIPRVLAETKAVSSSVKVATTRAGVNVDDPADPDLTPLPREARGGRAPPASADSEPITL
jgi:hypothetical protein